MAKKGALIKTFRSIRISEGLIIKIQEWLESKENEKLGIESVKDALEYNSRKGLQSRNKNKNTAKRMVLLKNPKVGNMEKHDDAIRISDGLIISFENWLQTKDAEKAGIDSLKDALEYFTRLGMKSITIQK